MTRDPRIEIGGIARAHGIRGEIAIVTHDPNSVILSVVGSVWVRGEERRVLAARGTARGWLVQLEGVTTRTEAELLRGAPVEVEREALGLAEDDVVLHDLVGCRVVRSDGGAWGTIVAIDPGPLQDRLVIHDGDVERLLPLVDPFVVAIDLEAGVVTVDPPLDLPETAASEASPRR